MTIGMLSGLRRTSRTCSFRAAKAPATATTIAIGRAILGFVQTSASWIDARRRTIEIPNRISGRVRKLMKSTTRGSAPVLGVCPSEARDEAEGTDARRAAQPERPGGGF